MAAPTSRPAVHPCVTSIFDGNTGSNYSSWAYLTTRPPQIPNLVTAQASTLRVYTLDEEDSGKLIISHVFSNLAGNICYLETLSSTSNDDKSQKENNNNHHNHYGADSLLIGFCGHPRLTIVSVSTPSLASASPTMLMATSLIDLTQALIDASYGSVTPLEEDMVAVTMPRKNNEGATSAIILGGGVAVAVVDIQRKLSGWIASEPYLLPLPSLRSSHGAATANTAAGGATTAGGAATTATQSSSNANVNTISTGFGDILATAFLAGYIEPTIVLLHSDPFQGGRAWPGRLGRPSWQKGTRYGLLVTALSVTVAHQRSAVLWSVEVPADAMSLHTIGSNGCLVLCSSSLLFINNAGRIEHFIAANGFARATCPLRILEHLKPNPKPFPKLAIQLDGAALACGTADEIMFLSLRCGQLYLLQIPVSGSANMALIPLGRTLGAVGQIASLCSWPLLSSGTKHIYEKLAGKNKNGIESISIGLLFAGSRLGDSTLLGYAVESIPMPWVVEDDNAGSDGKRIKREIEEDMHGISRNPILEVLPTNISEEDDAILQEEEEALYAPISSEVSTLPGIISDEDSDGVSEGKSKTDTLETTKRKVLTPQLPVMRAFIALDSITGLGPLGACCEGPIAPSLLDETKKILNPGSVPLIGSSAHILPCGYGSSGGLALLTATGRDERSIVAEHDCLDVHCVFSLPTNKLVFLGMKGKNRTGTRVLRVDRPENGNQLGMNEVDMDEWSKSCDFFSGTTLLSAAEFSSGNCFALVILRENESVPVVAVLRETSGTLENVACFDIPSEANFGPLLSMTPIISSKDNNNTVMMFSCLWNSGTAKLIKFNQKGIVDCFDLESSNDDSIQEDKSDEETQFYKSKRIVALDLFCCPSKYFDGHDFIGAHGSISKPLDEEPKRTEMETLLEDDKDLYGTEEQVMRPIDNQSSAASAMEAEDTPDDETEFLGICRQDGNLEIFRVSDLSSSDGLVPLWSAKGCGLGVPCLSTGTVYRFPQFHQVFANEIRFFFCGPSSQNDTPTMSRPLCVAIATCAGDILLYKANKQSRTTSGIQFHRVPITKVSRQSQEESRHYAKLKRKGIVSKVSSSDLVFRPNRFHKFRGLSGQDGLFSASSRPFWIVSERGKPISLSHRVRHAAPAVGNPRPVSFCSLLVS